MNATNRLLSLWWDQVKPESAVEAGKRLGVSGQAIANYRAGLSQAKPAVIAKMAADVGEDPGHWLAQVEAERAHNDRDRKAWATLARRLGAAAAVGAVALLFNGHTGDVLAATLAAAPTMHYAKSRGWIGGSAEIRVKMPHRNQISSSIQ